MNRRSRLILSDGALFGVLAGVVFAGEILLEYILLPQDNTGMGLVEFGLVFYVLLTMWFIDGIVTRQFSTAVLASHGVG